jgi:hypothetical protein
MLEQKLKALMKENHSPKLEALLNEIMNKETLREEDHDKLT